MQLAVGRVGVGRAVVVGQPVLIVVGRGAGAPAVGPADAVGVGVVVVVGLGGAVLVDVGELPSRVVGVVVGRGDAADRLHALLDPAEIVPDGVVDGEEHGAAVACRVARQLAVGQVVGIGVGEGAERRSGQEAARRVASERERARAGEQTILVVAVGDRVGVVDGAGGDLEVVVVDQADAACDRRRPGDRGRQRGVVRVAERAAVRVRDRGEVAARRLVRVAVGPPRRDNTREAPGGGVVDRVDRLAVRAGDELHLMVGVDPAMQSFA